MTTVAVCVTILLVEIIKSVYEISNKTAIKLPNPSLPHEQKYV